MSSQSLSLDVLESAIQAAQNCLAREQVVLDGCQGSGAVPGSRDSSADSGYWMGELEADTTLESDYIIFLSFIDRDAYRAKIRKFAEHLLRHQLPDGSWNIYFEGPGEISATVKAYLALRLAGHSPQEPCMQRAREAVLHLGGAERVNSFTKFYLALLGQIDWKDVPAIPPELILLPRFFLINIYEISYWSRAILVPLSILYSKRIARRPVEGLLIEELFHDKSKLRYCYRRSDSSTADAAAAISGNGANGSNGKSKNGGAHAPFLNGNGHNGHRLSALDQHDGVHHDSATRLERSRLDGARAEASPRYVDGFAPASPPLAHGPDASSVRPDAASNGNGNGAHGTAERTNGRPALRSFLDPLRPRFMSWENFFLMSDRLLKLVEQAPFKPLRRLALKKAEEWMVERFEDSDGLGAIFPSMVNSVMALLTLGYSLDHPLVTQGLEQLEALEIDEGDIARLQPCLSPIWDTAKAVNALHESGLPADGEILARAGRWLVAKEVRKPGDWKIRAPHVEVGGWPFQFRNEFYPDVDDTAAVVLALSRIDRSKVPGIEGSIERGINWIVAMQCSCGGWAAFDVDVQKEFLTKVPYADHNAMLDPPCADITGRCLEMFSRFPEVMKRPEIRKVVRRGVEYLKQSQESDGAWYGRWGVNYIYGTWQAIKGLVAVGEDPSQSYLRKAVQFILDRQNADGGWGESCASYDGGEEHRGRGESTASQTAWALMGLIAAGEWSCDAVSRGVDYLLRTQGADGNWEERQWTGTGFPSVFYLKYHLYRLYFPLFALGMYHRARSGQAYPRASSDAGAVLVAGAARPMQAVDSGHGARS